MVRVAAFSVVLVAFAAAGNARAAPLSQEEARQLVAPHLAVCMEIPIGPHRLGQADKALEAQITGLADRGLVKVTTIGQGDSLISGDTDLDRLEEQKPFTRLVDVALADGVDRGALCTMSRHRVGVPLGTQTVTSLTIEPTGDESREAQLLIDGTLARDLSRYALRFDPRLLAKATFQALVAYDNGAKAWVVRRFATQNAR